MAPDPGVLLVPEALYLGHAQANPFIGIHAVLARAAYSVIVDLSTRKNYRPMVRAGVLAHGCTHLGTRELRYAVSCRQSCWRYHTRSNPLRDPVSVPRPGRAGNLFVRHCQASRLCCDNVDDILCAISARMLDEGGANGFQISPPYYAPDYYDDLVSLLIPERQAQGLYRDAYRGNTLAEHVRDSGACGHRNSDPNRHKWVGQIIGSLNTLGSGHATDGGQPLVHRQQLMRITHHVDLVNLAAGIGLESDGLDH